MIDRLDPELVEPLQVITEATGGGFSLVDIDATRAMVKGMIAAVKADVGPIAGVDSEDRAVPGAPDDPDVNIRVYRPSGATDPLPALIWMHGGGFVLGDLELDDLVLRPLVLDVGCAVVSVDYRLAPEHPYPAAVEDCHAVGRWLARSASALGIDASRIAIGGGSAGGGIAAAVALMARDRGSFELCHQCLIYPAINDRNIEQAGPGTPENPFWSRANVLTGWRAYLGTEPGGEGIDGYAAPLRAENLAALPPAYMAVGAVDMFVPDCLEYGRRLIAAGVDTQLHVYPGAFHAFDAFAPMSAVAQRFVVDRNAALRSAFTR